MNARWLLLCCVLVAGSVRAEAVPGATTVSSGPTVVVNVNVATIDELCTLPGIGRKKAEAIVALRTRRPLTRVTQLLQVKGIGPKTLHRLKPMLSVAPVPVVPVVPVPPVPPVVPV